MGKSRQRQERQYCDHIDSTKKKHPPDKDGCKGKRNVLLWRTADSSSPKDPQIRHPRGSTAAREASDRLRSSARPHKPCLVLSCWHFHHCQLSHTAGRGRALVKRIVAAEEPDIGIIVICALHIPVCMVVTSTQTELPTCVLRQVPDSSPPCRMLCNHS